MYLQDDQNMVMQAVEWAAQHPNTLMPNIPAWAKYFTDVPAESNLILEDFKGQRQIENVAPKIIPFLVAVCQEKSLDFLASIIEHHKISTHDLQRFKFARDSSEFTVVDPCYKWIDKLDLNLLFIKACDKDPDLHNRIDDARIHYGHLPNVKIALLHSHQQSGWLSTRLSQETGDRAKLISIQIRSISTSSLMWEEKCWPKSSLLTFLERLGGLHESNLLGYDCANKTCLEFRYCGFWSTFMFESTFLFDEDKKEEVYKKMISMLPTEAGPKILRGIRSILPDQGLDLASIINQFSTHADRKTIPLSTLRVMLCNSLNDGKIQRFTDFTGKFSDEILNELVFNQPEQFVASVAQTLLEIPLDELGQAELLSLWGASQMDLPPQDLSTVDIEATLSHIFQAFALHRDGFLDFERFDKKKIELIAFLSRHHTFSEPFLERLSDHELEMVVRGGAAPQKRGKLSLQALGRAFGGDLGL
ncbi:hypothetical protein [Pseudomonas serbica]|uniref:hypothetical protein n=1 Tax=Pseudomonas serbica TaxID=2965074 RepID=UPI00237B2623|nr:hypothetical protein [Pseudomonas serbica]